MANNTAIYAVMALGLAGGVGWWYMNNQDKTPVGLVITNQVERQLFIGEDENQVKLHAQPIEGTWRKDEDSLSVASESAEKPMLVIFKDGKPIDAELITMDDWVIEGDGVPLPDECKDDDGNEMGNPTEECFNKIMAEVKARTEKWRALAKKHGATEESVNNVFPLEEESTAQEAESIFGPIMSLQSHFVW
tara:strand:- start:131 stop:703 length:573 start_codon:yes stop_codon:yes gene_type:complete